MTTEPSDRTIILHLLRGAVPDPYGLYWRTTERGAALSAIALLLEAAIDATHRALAEEGT